MTRLLTNGLKRLGLASLALGLILVPTLSLANPGQLDLSVRAPSLDLRAGSGAPAKSLIGAPALGAAIGGIDYSALLGLEIGPSGTSVGPRLSGEVMYGLMDLAPNLRLDIGGRAAFAYHGGDVSLWLLDFVPDAKIKYAIMDNLAVYGDFGLGLGYLHASVDVPAAVQQQCNLLNIDCGGSDSSIALTIQFGGGVAYAVTPTINLLGEIRFDIYTKSGSSTFINIPTVGVQFH